MPGKGGLGSDFLKRQAPFRRPVDKKHTLAAFNVFNSGFKYFRSDFRQLLKGIFGGSQHAVAAHQCSPGCETSQTERRYIGIDIWHMNHLQGNSQTFGGDLGKCGFLPLAHI